jgi:hypothetical protein
MTVTENPNRHPFVRHFSVWLRTEHANRFEESFPARLRKVHEGEIDQPNTEDSKETLGRMYEALQNDYPFEREVWAKNFRKGYQDRSLSVGDVLELGGWFFQVQRIGFEPVRVETDDISGTVQGPVHPPIEVQPDPEPERQEETAADAMRAALEVIAKDRKVKAWLEENDPMALRQVIEALTLDTLEERPTVQRKVLDTTYEALGRAQADAQRARDNARQEREQGEEWKRRFDLAVAENAELAQELRDERRERAQEREREMTGTEEVVSAMAEERDEARQAALYFAQDSVKAEKERARFDRMVTERDVTIDGLKRTIRQHEDANAEAGDFGPEAQERALGDPS